MSPSQKKTNFMYEITTDKYRLRDKGPKSEKGRDLRLHRQKKVVCQTTEVTTLPLPKTVRKKRGNNDS